MIYPVGTKDVNDIVLDIAPSWGRRGARLGWEHIGILYKAPEDHTKPQHTIPSPQQTKQSPNRLYKAPKRLRRAPTDYTKPDIDGITFSVYFVFSKMNNNHDYLHIFTETVFFGKGILFIRKMPAASLKHRKTGP